MTMSRTESVQAPPPVTGPKLTPTPSHAPQDLKNSLSTPSGPETQLLLSEGVYVAHDEITLGAVPQHPNYSSTPSTNVLDTKPAPPTAAPHLSTTTLFPVSSENPFASFFQLSNDDKPAADASSPTSKAASSNRFKYLATGNIRAYVAGDATQGPGQSPTKEPKDTARRRRPKTNILKSNSSLISRATAHEHLAKRLNERNAEDPFAFVNNGRAFLWLDLTSPQKADQLTKIMFTKGHPLCHDVNLTTRTLAPKQLAHLDVIIGFSTADIVWYEPMSQRYSRLNKKGAIHDFPVSSIKWLPGSDSLFFAAHFDGSLILYDKERDDAEFVAEKDTAKPSFAQAMGKSKTAFEVRKSQKSKAQKHNPVAVFKLGKRRITAIECSPDGRFIAAASEDGSLSIVDLLKEELTDVYRSYYGGFTCLSWSPDGKLLLSGSQDDLVSIWSFEERNIVARCMGHRSWVTSVAFDPWRCDGLNYRFGSVAEDCRMLLWDYSPAMAQGQNASIRPSIASTANLSDTLHKSPTFSGESGDGRRNSQESISEEDSVVHAAEPRSAVATLPPVSSKQTDEHPMSWIGFQENSIITACASGHIRTYARPADHAK